MSIPTGICTDTATENLEKFVSDSKSSGMNPLGIIRGLMKNTDAVSEPIHAYIVPSHDEHMSEYLADKDKRVKYVSGFSGSAGTLLITDDAALMWTDPRYFIQANQQLGPEWTLMKMGVPGVPNEAQWICANLPPGSIVGADSKTMPYTHWISMKTELEKFRINLVPVKKNLVDVAWGSDRPKSPLGTITVLDKAYSGMLSSVKVINVRAKMKENNANMLVLTALDDIAWLLNLRGNDIVYNPVFFSYVVVTERKVLLFIDEKKINLAVRNHFNKEDLPISLHPYENVYAFIKQAVEAEGQVTKVWLPSSLNFCIYDLVPPEMRFCECSPIALMKAIKNDAEIIGMINAHIKDGLALCQYFHWLENEIVKNDTLDEISVAEKLEVFRRSEEHYMGPSFETISASGPHAAIAHYSPDVKSNRKLSIDEIYLCDAGAQFLDGTTDVTRTMHFGCPSPYIKECFTRVLKGLINLTSCNFPNKVKGNTLDTLARKYLWDVGLDYGHGTGHGIGCYLNVHEGPMGISWRPYPDDPGLQENMFLSNEPGFYSENEFGIRIENIVKVVQAKTPYNFQNRGFLTFSTVTMCPIQTKMLVINMLTDDEIDFINTYHANVRETLTPILRQRGLVEVCDWIEKETLPILKE